MYPVFKFISDRMPKGDKFQPGDLVFAKVKGYPPWPARITGMSSKDRYFIAFSVVTEASCFKIKHSVSTFISYYCFKTHKNYKN